MLSQMGPASMEMAMSVMPPEERRKMMQQFKNLGFDVEEAMKDTPKPGRS
jgi:hypothetical protein